MPLVVAKVLLFLQITKTFPLELTILCKKVGFFCCKACKKHEKYEKMRKTFGGLKKKQYLCSRFLKEITARGVLRKDIELLESCLSGRKSRTRNAVYALRRTGGSNPSLSA